ncbi:MAG TPA: hypothetical protein DD723_05840 [Candidatus Omnitrophica bacterium]|nr:MAG: hypothetical protein A2Z81_06935 [Omnitrophica WOR_2 bacterium GWA2_45_18]HBR15047.1 hypothetical protein [Candidatus Omnitrophota bacterium]
MSTILGQDIFGRPFAGSEHAEIWNETLQKIADECYNHKALQSIEGKFGARLHHKRIDKSGRVSHTGTGYLEPVHADKRFYVSPVSYSSQGSTAPTPVIILSSQIVRDRKP